MRVLFEAIAILAVVTAWGYAMYKISKQTKSKKK